MNLAKLFQLQRQLDDRIEREHPVAEKVNELRTELINGMEVVENSRN